MPCVKRPTLLGEEVKAICIILKLRKETDPAMLLWTVTIFCHLVDNSKKKTCLYF